MKKLLTALFLVLFLTAPGACAEEDAYTAQTADGGVIDRGTAFYRTRALIEELNVAYMDASSPYLTKGVQTAFTVHATGGDGIYQYSFSIYRRSKASGPFYYEEAMTNSRSDTFYYTPAYQTGQYLLLIRITDSAGSYIEWQSQVYESSSHAASVKARALAEECRQNADSDYARALWLHDWLIYNAEYDYDYQYFYPDGVLLYGKGVCQSYALAYDMLLKLVGIDCIYVTGTAGGSDHGWNLVSIDGEWYHVDCTWDDPGASMECHDYFCVPDDVIARDHQWRHEPAIMPACTSSEYMYAVRAGASVCKSREDVIGILNEAVFARKSYVEIWYTGTLAAFDFDDAVCAWYDQASLTEGFLGYRYTCSMLSLKIEFDYGNGFQDASVPESITLDPPCADMDAGEEMKILVLSSPSSADKSGLVWTSSNPGCILVDNGNVIAVAPGFSVITAYHPGGASDEIILYVNSNSLYTLPAFMKDIEEEAFSGCALLETVVLPQGVLTVGARAFSDCALLKNITIPESVSYIAPDAFSGSGRVIIFCENGSYAHAYAEGNGIACEFFKTLP